MSLYNLWLPPAVAEEAEKEAKCFSSLVSSMKSDFTCSSRWISMIEIFIGAKSDVLLEDIEEVIEHGLRIFPSNANTELKMRWGVVIIKLLKRYGKKIHISIHWRPLYDTLVNARFGDSVVEGYEVTELYIETIAKLVQRCRKFFPADSASDIWSELGLLLENPWHNSAFEGSGYARIFLPMNVENKTFYTSVWVGEIIKIWDSIPNCHFWNYQWTCVIARWHKHCRSEQWYQWAIFKDILYTRFLCMLQLPVTDGNGSFPFPLPPPQNLRFMLPSNAALSTVIAKSIVYMLRPGEPLKHGVQLLDRLIKIIENYYHPLKEGPWTSSLEKFLQQLVISFQKRIRDERQEKDSGRTSSLYLTEQTITSFVRLVQRITDRAKNSTHESMAETVAYANSVMAYLEPSLLLPSIKDHMDFTNTTSINKLRILVTLLPYTGRALPVCEDPDSLTQVLLESLINALVGIDVNDIRKSVATMHLIGSVLSSVSCLSTNGDGTIFLSGNDSLEWLHMLFARLFYLLEHLEPRSIMENCRNETNRNFSFKDNYYLFYLVEIVLGKLPRSLFLQALNIVSEYISNNVVHGATVEIGLLCRAFLHCNPQEAAVQLIKPTLFHITSSFKEDSGFGGRVRLSPSQEARLEYYLTVLSSAITYAGSVLLSYEYDLQEAIQYAFEATSWKVNKAGGQLLQSVLQSLVLYYPVDQYRSRTGAGGLEEWFCSKQNVSSQALNIDALKWHLPSDLECLMADKLLEVHFVAPLGRLRNLQSESHKVFGTANEDLKVTLLRIYSALGGVNSCLPAMCSLQNTSQTDDLNVVLFIAGKFGRSVGSSESRDTAADIMHTFCKYLFEKGLDDNSILILAIGIMDSLANAVPGTSEQSSDSRCYWQSKDSFIISTNAERKKRPRWALIEKTHMHNMWRSSQSYKFYPCLSPSARTLCLMEDLLELALHNYETVRSHAEGALNAMLKRWPPLVRSCVLRVTKLLQDTKSPEHVVLGICAVLSTEVVLRHLPTDALCFSSMITGLLTSPHYESLKSQNAIRELFVKFNVHLLGVLKRSLKTCSGYLSKPEFADILSHINSPKHGKTGFSWYDLTADRVVLFVTLASQNITDMSYQFLAETCAHLSENLITHQSLSKILPITGSKCIREGNAPKRQSPLSEHPMRTATLTEIVLGQKSRKVVNKILSKFSCIHKNVDEKGYDCELDEKVSSSRIPTDKAVSFIQYDFSSRWPRTLNCISLLENDSYFSGRHNFYPLFARFFKRLVQESECGTPVLAPLLECLIFAASSTEMSEQCVAVEAFAGLLNSDVGGLTDTWESGMALMLENGITSSLNLNEEWAACVRFAVTGKGRLGTQIPLLRDRILLCLTKPLPPSTPDAIVIRRYAFISLVLAEIAPHKMPASELNHHHTILRDLFKNMNTSSYQVKKAIGSTLTIVCSNLCFFESFTHDPSEYEEPLPEGEEDFPPGLDGLLIRMDVEKDIPWELFVRRYWKELLIWRACTDAADTTCFFVISALRSGRYLYLCDLIVQLFAVTNLFGKSEKEFVVEILHLLKWIIPRKDILESVRKQLTYGTMFDFFESAPLKLWLTMFYRLTFMVPGHDKLHILNDVQKRLRNKNFKVREAAGHIFGSLLKVEDEEVCEIYRNRFSAAASLILNNRSPQDVVHGAVLGLTSSVLSSPFDMPIWLPKHVMLLTRFISYGDPIKSIVSRALAEFRQTHADKWDIQKELFTEEQLDVINDALSSSSSYLA